MASLIPRLRTRRRRPTAPPGALSARRGLVYDDLTAELPDEDLQEDLAASIDIYRFGSKPLCEEQEYLELVEDAAIRVAREG